MRVITDTDIRQRLNLVRTSGSFVLQEAGDQGEVNVMSMTLVPKESGVCWIRGQSIAKSGREIESVFRVGTIASIFWWIDGEWYSHEDADALSALGLSKEGVFPFDWRFDIPLEDDIFHPA
jgi:hypothetical protein